MWKKHLGLWLIQCVDWFTGTSSPVDHSLMIDIPRSATQSRRRVRPLELCHQSRRSLEHTHLARWRRSILKQLPNRDIRRDPRPHRLVSVSLHQGDMVRSHRHRTPHQSLRPRIRATNPTLPAELRVDVKLQMTRAISHRPGRLMKMSVIHHLWSGIRPTIDSSVPNHPRRLHPCIWVMAHSTDTRTLHYDTRNFQYEPCPSIFPLHLRTNLWRPRMRQSTLPVREEPDRKLRVRHRLLARCGPEQRVATKPLSRGPRQEHTTAWATR